MKNCPLCNSLITEKNIKDCGYSTFNIGTITCPECSLEITYNCVENTPQYIELWNKDVLDIEKILNLKEKEKTNFIKYILMTKNKLILKEFNDYENIKNNYETVNNDREILKKHNINLEVTDAGEILIPKQIEQSGIKDFIIKTLKLTSKIKIIKGD